MKCIECGAKNKAASGFCSSCGAQIERASKKDATHGTGFFSALKKYKVLAGVAVTVLVLTGVGTFALAPKVVHVSISIDTPNGGVFNSNCKLEPLLDDEITSELVATPRASEGFTDQRTEVEFISKNNKCIALGDLSVSPYTTYDLTLGKTMVGALSQNDVWAGKTNQTKSVAITRHIVLRTSFKTSATRCKSFGGYGSFTCWNIWEMFWKNTDGEPHCYATGYDRALKSGARITVTGKSNNKTTVGTLSDIAKPILISREKATLSCDFDPTKIEVPNDDVGYTVRVADRKPVSLTNQELYDAHWIHDLVFKPFLDTYSPFD